MEFEYYLFVLQISELSSKCNIDMVPRRPSNGRQTDGNIPLLPRAIKNLAVALRGGPFAYNGTILYMGVSIYYYTDQ